MANPQNFIIYKIHNSINDKLYIGQTTTTISKRYSQHIANCKRGKKGKLFSSMRKHGLENFAIKEICKVENMDELNEMEEFLIQELNTAKTGYNITFGGLNYIRYCKNGITSQENELIKEFIKKLKKGNDLVKFILIYNLFITFTSDPKTLDFGDRDTKCKVNDEEITEIKKKCSEYVKTMHKRPIKEGTKFLLRIMEIIVLQHIRIKEEMIA